MSQIKTDKPSSSSREQLDVSAARLIQLIQQISTELNIRSPALSSLNLDTSFEEDLGLDSLSKVELLGRIEKEFSVHLPEAQLVKAATPREILHQIFVSTGHRVTLSEVKTPNLHFKEIEATPLTLSTMVDVLEWHAARHPDRRHLTFFEDEGEGESFTYKQLRDAAAAFACGLKERDVESGDCVVLMLPTCRDYFTSFLGTMYAGAVPVPIYPPGRPAQIEDHLVRHGKILQNCGAKMVIASEETRRVARLLTSQTTTAQRIYSANDIVGTNCDVQPITAGPKSLAMLQYTSGSTGQPKGVMLTHSNLLANLRAFGNFHEVDATDVAVSWLPLYHDMGLISTWLGSLYYACHFVVMSPFAFLARPSRWLWALHRFKGSLTVAPNFAFEITSTRIPDDELEGLDLGSVRIAACGSEPISAISLKKFYDRFQTYGLKWEALTPAYGLAESTVALTSNPPHKGPIIDLAYREIFMTTGYAKPTAIDDESAMKFVSCGPPIPGHEVRIIGHLGQEMPERQEGRIQFRGPSVTQGYFQNPEETKKLFDGDWAESGDLGYMCKGNLFVTGRIKDTIIHRGRNIYPQEIEELVGEIAGVRKGCVVAFASEDNTVGTEKLIVVAETRETDPDIRVRLRKDINRRVTSIIESPPDEVIVAPPHTVLKTSSGKIRRSACRELYERHELFKPSKAPWLQVVRLRLRGFFPTLRRLANTVWFWIAGLWMWISAALSFGVILVGLIPLTSRRLGWYFMRASLRVYCLLAGIRIHAKGLENIPSGPCVFVANHSSYADGPLLLTVLSPPCAFVAKSELRQQLFPRFLLNKIGAVYVERFDQQRGVADARSLADHLKAGTSLMFFPEGTFTRGAGILSFHMGAFACAAEHEVPVVPIAIRGTRDILHPDRWWLRRGEVRIMFGEALSITDREDWWHNAIAMQRLARDFILEQTGEPDLAREKNPLLA